MSVLSGLTQKEPKKSRLRLLSYSVSSFRCARRKLAFGSDSDAPAASLRSYA